MAETWMNFSQMRYAVRKEPCALAKHFGQKPKCTTWIIPTLASLFSARHEQSQAHSHYYEIATVQSPR